jgi:hypothetical protein
MAGQLLGMSVGEYFIARCNAAAITGGVPAWSFDGTAYPGTQNFSGGEIFDPATGAPVSPLPPYVSGNPAITVRGSARLHWLWTQARAEWP